MLRRVLQRITDPATFFAKIGRGTGSLAAKFESMASLLKSSTRQLKDLGIDVRQRRYILSQLEKYRNGEDLHETKRGTKLRGGERKRKARGEKR